MNTPSKYIIPEVIDSNSPNYRTTSSKFSVLCASVPLCLCACQKYLKFFKYFWLLLLIMIQLAISIPVKSDEPDKVKERMDSAVEVLGEILSIPEKGIPTGLIENCKGLIIIPHMIKGGLIVAANRGKGIMIHRLPDGKWSNPAFCTITGGSIGLQIGGQATDLVLVVNSERGFQALLKDRFKFGAGISVAAGPVGRDATASTDAKLKADIYSYSRSKGLFAGVSIEGAGLTSDDNSNTSYYGKFIDRKKLLSMHSEPYPVPELLRLLSVKD